MERRRGRGDESMSRGVKEMGEVRRRASWKEGEEEREGRVRGEEERKRGGEVKRGRGG